MSKTTNKFAPEVRERAVCMVIDHERDYGVEPICRVLPIAPSTYRERIAQRQDPTRLTAASVPEIAI